MAHPKILLALLNSNGDCLYGTVIARQIKETDHPGCQLTWAVNSRCKQTILLNPYVDDIWELPTEKSLTTTKEWRAFVKQAEERKTKGDFDLIYYLQIIDKNVMNLDGDIRRSIYKNYPYPVTVSQQPILQLSDTEIQNVANFAALHQLHRFRQVILVECGPDSFISSLNPKSAHAFATEFAEKDKSIAFILSSNKKIENTSAQVIDGSVLSYRENAALTKYCSLLIGCSSGISWLSTSTAAKPLPKILVLNDKAMLNTSMVDDHVIAGLPVNDIIELHESADAIKILHDCFQKVLGGDFAEARKKYHQSYHRTNFKYLYHVAQASFSQWNFTFPFIAFRNAVKKDGFHLNALYYLLKSYVKLPFYAIRKLLSRN
jgi:hypothetical protein